MADITLSGFKSKVQDVARPNRFLLTVAPPVGTIDNETFSWHVKGAQIPGRTLGDLLIYWQGMQAKLAGDPTFEDFTVVMLNDYDQGARTTIENWMRYIDNQLTNVRTSQTEYKIDAVVDQLGRNGEILSSWKMFGFFPKVLDPIDLNQESVDQAGEFNVTFSLDYFEQIV